MAAAMSDPLRAKKEHSRHAAIRIGEAVNLAVERFVTVGETIADEYPEIKGGMEEACKEARSAG